MKIGILIDPDSDSDGFTQDISRIFPNADIICECVDNDEENIEEIANKYIEENNLSLLFLSDNIAIDYSKLSTDKTLVFYNDYLEKLNKNIKF